MRRPLVIAAAAFTGGCALAQWHIPSAAALIVLSLLAAVLCLALPPRRWRQALLLAALFAAAGGASSLMRPVTPAPLHPAGPYWITTELKGRVLDCPVILPGADYAQVLAETSEGMALLRWSDPHTRLLPGDVIRFRGEATTLLGSKNFGVQGPEEYHRARGVSYAVSVQGRALKLDAPGTWSLRRLAAQLRAAQADLLQRAVPPDALSFVMAVWLGQRQDIDREVNERYIETGTAHMLAVSGLHVGMVFLVLEFLLALFIRDPRARAALILVAIGLFTLVTGARVSTLRAAFMIAMYLSARFVRREPDAPTSLSLAAILFLAWNPGLLRDAGALLSFGSVASLLCYGDRMSHAAARWLRLPFWLSGPLTAGIAVQVLTLPLVAVFFQVVPLAAPLANIVAVPLLGIILMACVLLSFIGWTLPAFAPLFGHLAWLPWQGIEITVRGAAYFEFLALKVSSPTPAALACYYMAVALPLLWVSHHPPPRELAPDVAPPATGRWGAHRVALVAVLLLVSALLWRPAPPRGVIDFLDVGHGDAAVIYPPGGGAILVDGGDRSEYRDYGRAVVLPYLLAHGVTRLDAVVSTHPDRDHIGGLFSVLEAMPVERVLLSGHASGRPLEAGLIELCSRLDVPVERLHRGDQIRLGEALMEVLHPPRGSYAPASVNDGGVVMRVSWDDPEHGRFSALITGDIEQGAEAMLAETECSASILRVPHHGSHTSSTPAFIKAVNPKAGIVSMRQTRQRKAMGPGVAERYQSEGIPLWRTDLDGAIRVRPGVAPLSARGGE
ncbi:MAG: hypothetical protein RLZZ303_1731 [Candidatus Hydrogenedentota bacterium]|jgi:competence protein ComEC